MVAVATSSPWLRVVLVQREALRLERGPRLLGVAREPDLEALVAQPQLQHQRLLRIGIDDEHAVLLVEKLTQDLLAA